MQRQAAKVGEVYVSRYEAALDPSLVATATKNRHKRQELERSSSRSTSRKKRQTSSQSDADLADLSTENLELLIQKEELRVSRQEAHFLKDSKKSRSQPKHSHRSRRHYDYEDKSTRLSPEVFTGVPEVFTGVSDKRGPRRHRSEKPHKRITMEDVSTIPTISAPPAVPIKVDKHYTHAPDTLLTDSKSQRRRRRKRSTSLESRVSSDTPKRKTTGKSKPSHKRRRKSHSRSRSISISPVAKEVISTVPESKEKHPSIPHTHHSAEVGKSTRTVKTHRRHSSSSASSNSRHKYRSRSRDRKSTRRHKHRRRSHSRSHSASPRPVEREVTSKGRALHHSSEVGRPSSVRDSSPQ